VQVVQLARINAASAQEALLGREVHRLDDLGILLRGVAVGGPNQATSPVEVGLHGIWIVETNKLLIERRIVHVGVVDVLVAFDHSFGQTESQDGVPNPVDKLTVLVVGDFGFVHIEGRNRHGFSGCRERGRHVYVRISHGELTLGNVNHSVRVRRVKLWAVLNAY